MLQRSVSTAQRQFSIREPIQPFVSSTFLDFEEERDYLVKRIFPRLDQACHERGTYFAPVDLRWGISESQSSNGHVLRLCLDYIRKSSPYFICLLGEHYGSHLAPDTPTDHPSVEWYERNVRTAATHGFAWVARDENRFKSITELEVLQAVDVTESGGHAFFYFRHPDAIERQLTAIIDDDERERQRRIFGADSEFAARQMAALKMKIIEMNMNVKYFETTEELGRLVLDDWLDVIDVEYPSLLDDGNNVDGDVYVANDQYQLELFREWALHESFAETRRRAFVQTKEIERIHNVLSERVRDVCFAGDNDDDDDNDETTVADGRRQLIVLVGERGSGKTSVAANWIRNVDLPNVATVAHYVGGSAGSSDVVRFMRYCTAEIQRFFTGSSSQYGGESSASDLNSAYQAFVRALRLGPVVVVVDGVEEMTSGVKSSELAWLPEPIPSQCTFVVTVSLDHSLLDDLKRRSGGALVVEIPPLQTVEAKQMIIERHLSMHRKNLAVEQYEKIANCPLSDKPIFLAALANEMRLFGQYRDIDRHLDYFLESTSTQDLWLRIIRRWCQDYGWSLDSNASSSSSSWVVDALRLVAASRQGLTEPELLVILKRHVGYREKREVTSAHFALLRSAVTDALFVRPGGMLNFFHRHLRDAVVNDDENWSLRSYHKYLVDYFSEMPHDSPRRVEELPWQLCAIDDMDALLQVVAEPATFLALSVDLGVNHRKLDFLHYWQLLNRAGHDVSDTYKRMLETQRSRLQQLPPPDSDGYERLAKTGQAVGQFLAERHKFDDALVVLQAALHDSESCGSSKQNDVLLTEIQASIAHRYLYKLETNEAEKWYRLALETISKVVDRTKREHELQGSILNELGQLCARALGTSRLDDAQQYLDDARDCMKKAGSTPGIATNDYNMGILLLNRKLNGQAEQHLRRALETRERWYGQRHPHVADTLNQLAGLIVRRNFYQRDATRNREAMGMYERALEIREQHLGKGHLLVATTLFHMGKLFGQDEESKEKALICFKRALEIRAEALGESHLLTTAVARTINNLEAGKLSAPPKSRHQSKDGGEVGDGDQWQVVGKGKRGVQGRRGSEPFDHSRSNQSSSKQPVGRLSLPDAWKPLPQISVKQMTDVKESVDEKAALTGVETKSQPSSDAKPLPVTAGRGRGRGRGSGRGRGRGRGKAAETPSIPGKM